MGKKTLVGLIWIGLVVVGCVLYLLREVTHVKEFIAWALTMWPILSFLVVIGIATSTWIIKHDFGRPVRTKPKDDKAYIEYQDKGEWQFYAQEGPKRGQAVYRALEIWFVNNPKARSDNAIARKVTCSLRFYDRTTKKITPVFGCFTQPESVGLATIKDLISEIDEWYPNNKPRKLMVALKWPGDEIAYAFAKENFYDTEDGKKPDKLLNKGSHYVEVDFQGTGVEQPPMWFILTNPGNEGQLSVSDPIKKPDLRKEGFQSEITR